MTKDENEARIKARWKAFQDHDEALKKYESCQIEVSYADSALNSAKCSLANAKTALEKARSALEKWIEPPENAKTGGPMCLNHKGEVVPLERVY